MLEYLCEEWIEVYTTGARYHRRCDSVTKGLIWLPAEFDNCGLLQSDTEGLTGSDDSVVPLRASQRVCQTYEALASEYSVAERLTGCCSRAHMYKLPCGVAHRCRSEGTLAVTLLCSVQCRACQRARIGVDQPFALDLRAQIGHRRRD